MKKYYLKEDVEFEILKDFDFHQDCKGNYSKCSRYCGEPVEIFLQQNKTFFIEWGWYIMQNDEQERFLKDLIDANLVEEREED